MGSEDNLLVESWVDGQWHEWQLHDRIIGPCTPLWAEHCGSGLFGGKLAGKLGGYINKFGVLIVAIAMYVSLAAPLAVRLAFIWITLVGSSVTTWKNVPHFTLRLRQVLHPLLRPPMPTIVHNHPG